MGMARRLRLQFPGALYHVTFRGVERRDIFCDKRDRFGFLERLAERVEEYGVELHLYCLMSNHVHLLVGTPKGNLSAFMGSLLTSYGAYFNVRHGRSGHLMQGRYGAQLVEGDRYLLKLSRYIHLNPVCTGEWRQKPLGERRAALRRYPWSSYRAYIGLAQPKSFLTCGPTLSMLEGGSEPKALYRRFVEAGLEAADEDLVAARERSGMALGTAEYVERMEELHGGRAGAGVRREDVAFRRMRGRVAVERVLEAVAAHYGVGVGELRRRVKGGTMRTVLAALLTRASGLTQREAASAMGLTTGAAVCIHLRRLRSRDGDTPRKAVDTIMRLFNF